MKVILLLCSLLVAMDSTLFSQASVILQPGHTDGKDAEIWSLRPNAVFEDDLVRGVAWTFQGTFGIVRGFLQFDLSSIPVGSVIDSAFLSLYAPHPPNMQFHSGESAAFLRRITTGWDETTVSWNHQPITTNVHQVTLPKASADYKDYLDLNVTSLVRDMIHDPLHSFGFALILQDEQKYNRISFCASEYPDETKHPKLEIYYTPPDVIEPGQGEQTDIVFLPNPCTTWMKVQLNKPIPSIRIQLLDVLGRILFDQHIDPSMPIDMSSLPAALYVVRCLDVNDKVLAKVKMIKIQE
ncbi:MAG: DNRLRE domain-containing protein [Saprospiraceae bacterium]|nr:DNRLRE domain-containing protein [Saprospiraceae bacterium]